MRRSRGGFTLVEMLVAIAASAIVVAAGMSFVVLCLRVQSTAYEDVARQNTASVTMSLIEELIYRNEIQEPTTENKLIIIKEGAEEKVLLFFEKSENTLYVGGDKTSGGTVLLKNVEEFKVEAKNQLLTVTLKLSDDLEYTTTMYCRTWNDVTPTPSAMENRIRIALADLEASHRCSPAEYAARSKLLYAALSQEGSTGMILGEDGAGKSYTNWYCDKKGITYDLFPVSTVSTVSSVNTVSTWNKDTPWCATFVSWCLAQVSDRMPCYADVAEWYARAEESEDNMSPVGPSPISYVPDPGDMIFLRIKDDPADLEPGDFVLFNYDGDYPNVDHIGIVIQSDNGTIYTVEGNHYSSDENNSVQMFTYSSTDERIIRYATVDMT